MMPKDAFGVLDSYIGWLEMEGGGKKPNRTSVQFS